MARVMKLDGSGPGELHGLGRPDVVLFGQSTFAGLASAKGGKKVGGDNDGGTTTFVANPYTAGTPDTEGQDFYNIRIEFKGTWSQEYYDAFTRAAELLCDIIQDGLQDVRVWSRNTSTLVDDITITAELKYIDGVGGVLGQAGPTSLRTNGYLPATASMQFDSADAATYLGSGLWDDIILHEMMHSIGFGTIWSKLGLVSNYEYTGTEATAFYDGNLIPVESGGGRGTAGSHWSEAVFDAELMTGYIDNPTNSFSEMSIASLADLGYGLAPDAANQYALNGGVYLLV